ncbi:GumC family protein [Flavobacterium sp.]|uniref:GumC family protein n=1 Tax=Flavobacterium sp. TaxID=239 RepID=UPI003D14E62F
MQNNNLEHNTEEKFDLKQILSTYVRAWKWFVLSVIICFVLAKVYLRYTVPVYKASATILIKDEDSGGLASELSVFKELDVMGSGSRNIDDEIEILRSRSLAEKTIKKGGFNVSYFTEGRIKSVDSYGENLINLKFTAKDSLLWDRDTIMAVQILSSSKYELFDAKSNSLGEFAFGQVIKSKDLGGFSIEKNRPIGKRGQLIPFSNVFYKIQIQNISKLTEKMAKDLKVEPLTKKTNVLELTLNDQVAKRAEDYLNTLISIYNFEAVKDKNTISQKTADFINDRLEIITSELDGVEKQVESFKSNKHIVDIPTEAELNLRTNQEVKLNEISSSAKLQVVDMMLLHLRQSQSYDAMPINIIPGEASATNLIGEFNNLIVERNRLLQSSTENNPTVLRLNDKIISLKESIKESLKRLRGSLQVETSKQKGYGDGLDKKINALPKIEREFRNIFRQQQIKEELYLYLFKKREETAITLAGTAPISKVVDKGFSNDLPISPKRQIVYVFALLLGIFIPFAVIYIVNLLDTKVKRKEDLDKLGIPFLGDVPHSDSNEQVIQSNSRTSSAEAIRIVRTNLEFVLSGIDSHLAKTIFVTSTVPGEGKSFMAANLASTIAISGKRVLLIGLDIRNPKIDEYFNVPHRGVTNFLMNSKDEIEKYLLQQSGYEHFDILPSGVIPPNPAELLMNMRLDLMFDELKAKYDYIVVDTAPVSLVTDTLLISKNANAFVYVVRSNYLDKEMLKIPSTLYQENKLPNMAVVLNDTDVEKGYGYGYGYGQEVKKKSILERIKEFIMFKK